MSQTTENYDPDQYNWRDFIDRFPCTAHITAWHNQQYHAKSKVMIPTDLSYNGSYNKSTLKMFQNLKNELTYESLKDDTKVAVEYKMRDTNENFKSENKHIVTIVITKDWMKIEKSDIPEHIKEQKDKALKHYMEEHYRGNRTVDVPKYMIKGIIKNLPKGYEFSSVEFESNNFDGGYGLQNNAITRIHFEKFVDRKRVY
jgi:hypothetical protein